MLQVVQILKPAAGFLVDLQMFQADQADFYPINEINHTVGITFVEQNAINEGR